MGGEEYKASIFPLHKAEKINPLEIFASFCFPYNQLSEYALWFLLVDCLSPTGLVNTRGKIIVSLIS